jgi:hypothetical protein
MGFETSKLRLSNEIARDLVRAAISSGSQRLPPPLVYLPVNSASGTVAPEPDRDPPSLRTCKLCAGKHGGHAMRTAGWPGFLLWALVGVFWGFTALAMMSIGIFMLPVAIGATVLAAWRVAIWPEILGLASAPAFAMGFLAWRFWSNPKCGAGDSEVAMSAASGTYSLQPGSLQMSEAVRFTACTDLDVKMLALGALACITAAVIAYLLARGARVDSPPEA